MKFIIITISLILATCFFCFVNLNCGTAGDTWLIEWQFLNIADSTGNIKSPQYEVELIQSGRGAGIEYSLTKDGMLLSQIGLAGDEDWVEEFPSKSKLHFKFWYDTLTVFDSTFTFDEMNFKMGYSIIYKTKKYHVSNKTFYIKVP